MYSKFKSINWIISPIKLVVLFSISLGLKSCFINNSIAKLETQLTAKKILIKDYKSQISQLETDKRTLINNTIALESDTIKLRYTIDSLMGEYSNIIAGRASQIAVVKRQVQSNNRSYRHHRSAEEIRLYGEHQKIEHTLLDIYSNVSKILASKVSDKSVAIEQGVNWVAISVNEKLMAIRARKDSIKEIKRDVVSDTIVIDSSKIYIDSVAVKRINKAVETDSTIATPADTLLLKKDSVKMALEDEKYEPFISGETSELKDIVAYLNHNKDLQVEVLCYISSKGSLDKNQEEAIIRGQKTAKVLSSLGLDSKRVSVVLKNLDSSRLNYNSKVVIKIVVDNSTLSAAVNRMVER